LVAADLTTSQLLPPFIIDTGKFGATLMRRWAQYRKSCVVFNQTHWMCQKIAVMFLTWIAEVFRIAVLASGNTPFFMKKLI
jgi:hypothetical protein